MKLGNKNQQQSQPMDMPPMPQQEPMMDAGMPPMDDNTQNPPMDDNSNAGGMPPMDNGMEGQNQDFSNQFDNHFDAGVEADENEDPENYIKQLTGKLAQKLRSFNKDNGDDESLNKYAAKMVIKAAAENMSSEAKSDLKQAINTASSDEDEEDMDNDNGNQDDMSMDDSQNGENQNMDDDMQQPMNEHFKVLTKKQLREAFNQLNGSDDSFEKENNVIDKTKKRKKETEKNPFSGPKMKKK